LDGGVKRSSFLPLRPAALCFVVLQTSLLGGCGARSSLFSELEVTGGAGAQGAGGSGGKGGHGSGGSGGSGAADACPTGALTALVLDQISGYHVAVSEGEVYFSLEDGRIGKTGALGGATIPLFLGEGPAALASGGGRLFAADVTSGKILSIAQDGTESVALAASQSAPQSLALDETHAIWINYGFGILAGSVARVPKGGGEVEVMADSVDQGIDVAVDAQAVYFTSWGIYAGVYRIDKGTLEKQALVTSFSRVTGIAIDDESVYFAAGELGGSATVIAKIPKLGGDMVVLAADLPSVLRVAVDATHVYWTASGATDLTGSTGRVPKTGGPVETLAVTPDTLHSGLALDAEAVYFTRGWLEDVGPPPDGAAVVRVCK
jgi:hypothetical protein